MSLERERTPGGGAVPAVTLFLVGAECPFTCVFCDLWRYTLDGDRPTRPGDLPHQVATALGELEPVARRGRLKLYNASNFFDPRAVPPADLPRLAALAEPFDRVVVECHPRLVGDACLDWGARLAAERDCELEVALGLETIHPRALPRLGKRMTLDDFDRAVEALAAGGFAARAFVLVGAPYVPAAEAVEWAVRSAEHAFSHGAESVSLIPLRAGNGTVERLIASGEAALPALSDLEAALDACLELDACRRGGGIATADLWDLDRLAGCAECFAARRDRLARLNLSGDPEPPVDCPDCGR